MTYEVVPSKDVLKYLKKLREKPLKTEFLDLIYNDIALEPLSGTLKTGIYTKGFIYRKTHYRVAYKVENNSVIPVLLAGAHEGFYEQLKRKLKS
ncbi:type II toxin-antitoxin system RelE/ParE family toxin [Pseudolactococcus yaeyamensis]